MYTYLSIIIYIIYSNIAYGCFIVYTLYHAGCDYLNLLSKYAVVYKDENFALYSNIQLRASSNCNGQKMDTFGWFKCCHYADIKESMNLN